MEWSEQLMNVNIKTQPSEIGLPELPYLPIEKDLKAIVETGLYECDCGFKVNYRLANCPICAKENIYHV